MSAETSSLLCLLCRTNASHGWHEAAVRDDALADESDRWAVTRATAK